MQTRPEIKATAKQMLSGHWRQGVLITLIPTIISCLTVSASTKNYFISIIGLIGTWLMIGSAYTYLDWYRTYQKNKSFYKVDQPVMSCFSIWSSEYIGGTICILLLRCLFVFLWALLLLIPGIIKNCAYSQALFIYKEHVEAGEHVGALQCLGESQQLMMGHKWEYFVYELSFVGWEFICAFTLGIGFFWLNPYQQLTYAGYFYNLRASRPIITNAKPATKIIDATETDVK